MTNPVSMAQTGQGLTALAMTAAAALAMLAAAAALAGCGGSTDERSADPPTSLVTVLDVDTLGTADAVAREATALRGAPGEAEPVVYVVMARRPHDAEQVAADLRRRGFSGVTVGDPQAAGAAATLP